jgi:Cd2+/Zn2+-exporting ATPase
LVEEAQAQKAPAQALVERFGRVYTPLVIVAAASLALIGPWLAPGADWTYRALTLLVVACPCALVIATPVAYVSGIARAARGGVLVKGGAYLEALAGVRHVAFDKTGTLTAGAPAVVAVRAAAGVGEDELLAVAAAVERQSEHPLAAAVVAEARRRGVSIPGATAAAAVPGRGVTGTVDGSEVLVGNASLLAERDVAVPPRLRDEADEMAGAGKTPLLVARGGRALGLIAVADPLRPEAPEAIALLRRLGASPSILTGDQDAVARAVAREAGIDDVRAGLLPQDKLDAVRVLRASDPNRVAFVGDGINDAPALAAATVGIAIGAGGTAAALEAADVALMTGDLSRLPWTIRLARATRAVVRQNILVSMAVVALLATTVTGLLSLPLGVLGHEGSALLVILNGLRLLSPRLTRL